MSMRVMEFRGKVSADMKVGDVTYEKGMWVYGSLCTNSPVSIIPHDKNVFIEVDEDSVGRFTGLLTADDRNKIYESDRVKVHQFLFDGHGEVENEMIGVIKNSDYGWILSEIECPIFQKTTGFEKGEGSVYLSQIYGLHEESFTILD